jgi:chemotaxis protein histidine kinase CheA
VGSKLTVGSGYGALETSEKGKGFAYAGGTLSSGAGFGNQGDLNTLRNTGRGSKTPEQAAAEYTARINDAMVSAIAASDAPSAVKKIISAGVGSEAIIAAIGAQANAVSSFSAVIGLLPFDQLKTLAYDAKAGLLAAAGGLESLRGSLKTYYDNFYTESEKAANSTRNVTEALSAAGVALPATREAFRSIVDAQDLTTEAGQKAYAALLGVSGAFAELHPIVVAEKDAVKDLSTAKTELTTAELQYADLTKTNTTLQEQLNSVMGITPIMLDAANTALNENNKAIQLQIDGINAKSAADKLAADGDKSLRDRLFALQGTAEQKREKEIAGYGESNRALATYVMNLEDGAAAIANAAQVAEQARIAVAQAQSAASSTQSGLVNTFDPAGSALRAQQEINAAFAQFNASDRIPKTAKELSDLVASLNPRQAYDQSAIAKLGELQGAFGAVFGAADAAAKAAQDAANAQGKADQDAASSAAKSAQDAAEAQAKAAQDAANAQAKAAEDYARAFERVHDSISSALDAMMGQSEQFADMQRQQAKITLQSALAVAKAGGSLVGFAGLDDALKNIGNIDKSGFNSYVDYAREYGQSVGMLSELAKYTAPNGSHANGLDNVPFDGYMAQLHKGERVQTASEAKSGGESALQLKEMREELKAMIIPLVEESVRSRKILSKWDGDGMPEVRSVV